MVVSYRSRNVAISNWPWDGSLTEGCSFGRAGSKCCRGRRAEQTRRDEKIHRDSKHRRDDDETKQPLSSTSTLRRVAEKKKGSTNIPDNWSCHSRQSSKIGLILGTVKTDGQASTCHSGKDINLTVEPIPVTQVDRSRLEQREKKTSAFWS